MQPHQGNRRVQRGWRGLLSMSGREHGPNRDSTAHDSSVTNAPDTATQPTRQESADSIMVSSGSSSSSKEEKPSKNNPASDELESNFAQRAWTGFVNTTMWGEDSDTEEGNERRRKKAEKRAVRELKGPNVAQKAWTEVVNTTMWGEDSDTEEGQKRRRKKEAKRAADAEVKAYDQEAYDANKEEADLDRVDTSRTLFEQSAVDGRLYRDGQLVLQPAPTKDPRDPLNLPLSRKIVASFFLCFFGAMAASAELILGSMLPVFALQYAGIDPKFLKPLTENLHGFPKGADPLETLELLPHAQPIWKIYLLASLPVLMIGIANMGLIPIAIAVGRRPVVLVTGIVAIAGAIWAGFSGSLGSHLGARCVQALGAGTVESLIPFIIQDMVYVHERNTWISGVFAAQGVIIIALGIASPYIIINISWRYVYFITAALAGFFLIGVFFFMPETRWGRTKSEMGGMARREPVKQAPQRTLSYDIAIFHGKKEWKKGWNAFVVTLRTFFYPQILFITMLNSAMVACAFASGYTVAPALLTQPWSWPFLHLGLCLVPVLISAIFVGGLTGWVADWTANLVAKKRGKRVPENQLLNLILPVASALVGSLLFGYAGEYQDRFSWGVFLLALGLQSFGFLGANTIGAVYVLECYPHLAGPSLVNIGSFRAIIAFVLSFRVSEWVAHFGYLKSMVIYTSIMAFFALLIPVVYVWGPAWRRRWPATHYKGF